MSQNIDNGYYYCPYIPPLYPKMNSWTKHFAWMPVTNIHGKKVWLKTVYRRSSKIRLTTRGLTVGWEYGDIFDVLKSSEELVEAEPTTVNPPPRVP